MTYAIQSVLAQLHQHWTLLICDDGSTDATPDICKQFTDDPRVKYLPLKHYGVSAARNKGLSLSRKGFIAFIDSDNTWKKDYLSQMLAFMHDRDLSCAYCAARLFDEKNVCDTWLGDRFDWTACLDRNYIDLNCFMVDASKVVDKQIRFDESLKRFVDWKFILDITRYTKTEHLSLDLVDYYNGNLRNRITNSEYPGEEQDFIIDQIRSSFV